MEKLGFDKELLESIIKIVTNAPNDNISKYLDTVTEEQVEKASKKYIKL